jgi:hypothetical protein
VKRKLKPPKHVAFSSFSVFEEDQALQEGTLVFVLWVGAIYCFNFMSSATKLIDNQMITAHLYVT